MRLKKIEFPECRENYRSLLEPSLQKSRLVTIQTFMYHTLNLCRFVFCSQDDTLSSQLQESLLLSSHPVAVERDSAVPGAVRERRRCPPASATDVLCACSATLKTLFSTSLCIFCYQNRSLFLRTRNMFLCI